MLCLLLTFNRPSDPLQDWIYDHVIRLRHRATARLVYTPSPPTGQAIKQSTLTLFTSNHHHTLTSTKAPSHDCSILNDTLHHPTTPPQYPTPASRHTMKDLVELVHAAKGAPDSNNYHSNNYHSNSNSNSNNDNNTRW